MDVEQQLWDFATAYDAAFERSAEASGLSAAQACTLTPLLDGSCTMRELADQLECDASNITQLVTRLEGRGLVTRTVDPDDGRVRRVQITPQGRRLRRAVARSFVFPADRLARLSERQRKQLSTILERMLG